MQRNPIIPEHIIIDILSLLPVKSIGRCRCVSKPWKSLLSQPQFINTHLKNRLKNLQRQSFILVSDSGSVYSVTFSNAHHLFDEITQPAKKLSFANYPDSWAEILGSCDGLVLIKDKEDKIFLINPITREIKEVPHSPFALNPRASFIMYGFGYDSISDDYKVVSLSYYDTDNEYEPDCTEMFVNVYSVKSGYWKKAESSPYDHAVGHITSGVFVDGCIHWLASETTDYSSVIAAFDLAEEKFHEVPLPSSVDIDKFVFNHLVELGGCLCMFTDTDIWVMKEYGVQESWGEFIITFPEESEIRPLCMLGQEQVVLVKDEETREEKLVIYNLEKRTSKDIMVDGISDEFKAAGSFIESLLSPHFQ